MEKLQAIIQQYGRWSDLGQSIERIHYQIDAGFLDGAVGASKALLETICKTILEWENIPYGNNDNVNKLAKETMKKLNFFQDGTQEEKMILFENSLVTAMQNLGSLRNFFDGHAHGKSLSSQPPKIDPITVSFLVYSTELLACFFIEVYERQNPINSEPKQILFEDCSDFNEHLDTYYGVVHVTNIPYSTSEVLFAIDKDAYKEAYNEYLGLNNEQVN